MRIVTLTLRIYALTFLSFGIISCEKKNIDEAVAIIKKVCKTYK